MKSNKSGSLLKFLLFLLMLTPNGKENTFSAEEDLNSFPPDELIDRNLSTDDDINPYEGKGLLKAYVESISSESLIEDVEPIDEDIREEKDIYLLKKNLSSRDHSEGLRSKDNPTFGEKITLNTDLESQASNELIEGVRSVGLKPLKLDQSGVSHSPWSLRPAISRRSGLQSPLKPKPKPMDFWSQKDKVNQNAGAKILNKRKFPAPKDQSFKSIDPSQADLRHQDLVENSDEEWEIRRIIDMRETKGGREYKVVWASTWVNEKYLANATNLISEFRDGKRVKLST